MENSHWNLIVIHPTEKEKEGEGGYYHSRTQMSDVIYLLDNKHRPLRRFSHSSDTYIGDHLIFIKVGAGKKHELEITYFSTTREASK